MKKFFFLSILLLNTAPQIAQTSEIRTADDITYEWLTTVGAATGYTDHIIHFQKLFQVMKVRTFLEFGLGFSTKYFLDSSKKVISVEFITNGYGPEWMKSCIDLYRDYPNWIPIAYFSGFPKDTSWAPYKYLGSEHVYKAGSYQCATHKNYALIDKFYLTELDAFITNCVKTNKIDVAFVDSGLYLRGDLVQLLFGKVPVILAHDTRCRDMGMQDDVYGYSRIVTPEDYEEIFISSGQGTTVWIKRSDQYREVAAELKTYAENIE